ncbi:MAG: DNA mismatch repair protein MutS [Calditrichaeota bacterium]|nr:MAG: DNA mismatch repair protein MutS [Calditrichota bacterium]
MRQYLDIKSQNEDSVLFFRMGDFYELFYDDAKIASDVLGITLTSRGNGAAASVPLAGFPYHALDTYLSKMVKAGYRVAICDQVEDPKLAKTIVKRAVTQIVSPGTVLTDDLLDSRSNNYLCSINFEKNKVGLATVDISTGEFRAGDFPRAAIVDHLNLIHPAEILIAEEQVPLLNETVKNLAETVITSRDGWVFSFDFAYEKLTQHFKTLTLKGFGCEDLTAGIGAAGAALYYLQENQKNELEHINLLVRDDDNTFVGIDFSTQRNLEIVRSLRGGRDGTLISVLDKTSTPMGARLLANWLVRPLNKVAAINHRLDAVDEFVQKKDKLQKIQDQLRGIGDIERIITKIITLRANARDLIALTKSLRKIQPLKEVLADTEAQALKNEFDTLDPLIELITEIEESLVDDPPLAITDGGVIRKGCSPELDKLREIAYSGKDWILQLQKSEREKTGIPSLKVSFNKVFGYYIEVTKPNLPKVPEHYIRKQTLVNAERFITPELKEYEEQILGAEEKIVSIEYELFNNLRLRVASFAAAIQKNAIAIAELDCFVNFAELAVSLNYCKPHVNESTELVIEDGRHPVIETLLPFGENFIPNDSNIDCKKSQIQIITGPNMAGKSTYLRQVALIVLMAQIGSFVPAKSLKLGIVDKIFTRVGASDNLAAGESTFLVEMNETANILNNATPRSIILLDEIGRGTSTFDGLSIAWSIVEYLHENKNIAAKTMFATHYHELTELEMIFKRVKNFNVAVKEWGEQIIFLRKIVAGGTDHSYGIQVAKLAGIPAQVIQRAREVLSNLEQNALTPNHKPKIAARKGKETDEIQQLDFFSSMNNEIIRELQMLDMDNLTPMQAFQALIKLKEKVSK